MALISYPQNPGTITDTPPSIASAADVMSNFNAITAQVNGNLDDTNIAAGGVGTSSLADGAVTDIKVTDIDGAKIQAGTLPLAALGFPLAGGPGNVPVGSVLPFAGNFAPAQFVMCDGQALDKVTYALLYATIGDKYSTPAWQGANPTDFKVPDLRQRIPVGMGDDPLALPGYGFLNDLGLNEGVDQDAQATDWPGHQHNWTLPVHTHNIPPHFHDTFAGAGSLSVAATTAAVTADSPSALSVGFGTKWRLSNGAGLHTATPVPANTGPASAGPAHTHGLNAHRHDVLVNTGTVSPPTALAGPNPDTPATDHKHGVPALSATGTASYNAASSDTGTSISASTTVSMGAVATQQTAIETIPFLVLNYIIYTGV